jgi:hypothetical protein
LALIDLGQGYADSESTSSARRPSGKFRMKITLLFTGSGPLVIATSHDSLLDPVFLEKLRAKGIAKCIAYELQPYLVKERYAGHYDVVMKDLRESDDLRVLDFNGERAFRLFHLKELGPSLMFEGDLGFGHAGNT